MKPQIVEFQAHELSEFWGPLPPANKKAVEKFWIQGLSASLDLLQRLPRRGFGVVGTRKPQAKTVAHMEKVFKELKNSELIIVSGLARGVDSKAHELALQSGLKTIAVLGCGLNHTYPYSNKYLRNRIVAEGGLIMSDYKPDTPPYPGNFLERNRWIPFLSQALWVTEAGAYSGSINTATHAYHSGKPVLVTPSFPGDPFFEGNDRLLLTEPTQALINANSLIGIWPDDTSLRIQTSGPNSPWPKSLVTDAILQVSSQHSMWPVQALMHQLPDFQMPEIFDAIRLYEKAEMIESPRSGWYQIKTTKKLKGLDLKRSNEPAE